MVRQYELPRRGNHGRGGRRGGHHDHFTFHFEDFDKPDRRSAKQKMRAAFEEAQDAIDRNGSLWDIAGWPGYRPQRNPTGVASATTGGSKTEPPVAGALPRPPQADPAILAALTPQVLALQARVTELFAPSAQRSKPEPRNIVKTEAVALKAEENNRNDVVNKDNSKHDNLAGFPPYIKREY